jgi:hypothetical protein
VRQLERQLPPNNWFTWRSPGRPRLFMLPRTMWPRGREELGPTHATPTAGVARVASAIGGNRRDSPRKLARATYGLSNCTHVQIGKFRFSPGARDDRNSRQYFHPNRTDECDTLPAMLIEASWILAFYWPAVSRLSFLSPLPPKFALLLSTYLSFSITNPFTRVLKFARVSSCRAA